MNKKQMVHEFHRFYGCDIGSVPKLPADNVRELRKALIKEEFEEYLLGEKNNDLVEIVDALGDLLYVIYGACITYGLPIDEVFEEIHRSNLSKLGEDGKPLRRADGKIVKGPNYFPPNIKGILEKFQNPRGQRNVTST